MCCCTLYVVRFVCVVCVCVVRVADTCTTPTPSSSSFFLSLFLFLSFFLVNQLEASEAYLDSSTRVFAISANFLNANHRQVGGMGGVYSK